MSDRFIFGPESGTKSSAEGEYRTWRIYRRIDGSFVGAANPQTLANPMVFGGQVNEIRGGSVQGVRDAIDRYYNGDYTVFGYWGTQMKRQEERAASKKTQKEKEKKYLPQHHGRFW